MKNLSTHITESFQEVNESDATKIYFVAEKAKSSLLKDLRTNKVKFTLIKGNQYEIEVSDKASMSIRMAKERFGLDCILVKTVNEELITEALKDSKKLTDDQVDILRSNITKYLSSVPDKSNNPTKEYVGFLSNFKDTKNYVIGSVDATSFSFLICIVDSKNIVCGYLYTENVKLKKDEFVFDNDMDFRIIYSITLNRWSKSHKLNAYYKSH